MGSLVTTSAGGLLVGIASGFATAGVTGPLGPVVGAARGSAVGGVVKYRDIRKQHRERGWVPLDLQIRAR
jgi:hypothetical protein